MDAHALALKHLRGGGKPDIFNCGYGRGFSVREIAAAVERACGYEVPVRELPRRPGDLAAVVSDPQKTENANWAGCRVTTRLTPLLPVPFPGNASWSMHNRDAW